MSRKSGEIVAKPVRRRVCKWVVGGTGVFETSEPGVARHASTMADWDMRTDIGRANGNF